jgi:hypothetical protein
MVFPVLLFLPRLTSAQVADPHVLACSGSEGVNTDLKMEWTMGQMAVGHGGNNHYHLTQGFHQPMRPANTVGITELDRLAKVLHVWPNPVTNELNVQLRDPSTEKLEIAVYDERGASLLQRLLPRYQEFTTLPTGMFAAGNYLLVVREASGALHGMARFTKVQ